jgi:hypothetical protein
VGKTSLVCGLIRALPEFGWTAVKITSHEHGKLESIWEETRAGQGTDTARYLAAGARRSLLVTALGDELPFDSMRAALGEDSSIVFESNRIASQWKTDLCIGVLGGPLGAIKPSFQPFLERADAFVSQIGVDASAFHLHHNAWTFPLVKLDCVSPEMLTWLKARIRTPRTG